MKRTFKHLRGSASIFTLVFLLAGCNGAGVRNPFVSLHDSFEGNFIDERVESKSWIPPQQRDWTGLGLKGEDQTYPLPSGQVLVATQFQGSIVQRQMERYLENILASLASHSPVTGVAYDVAIVGDGGYGNPQSMPDGVLAIPLGFLANAESEDEIAWLLGHEFAHVILAHHDTEWIRNFQSGLAGTARNALHATQLASLGLEQLSNGRTRIPLKKVEQLYSTTKILFDIGTGGALPAWQRTQEDEADLLATDLIVRAGYAPDAGLDVIRKIGLWAAEEVTREEQRLAAQAAAQKEFDELSKNFSFEGVFDFFGNIMEREARRFRSRARQTHRDAEPRQARLEEYIDARYPEIDRDANENSWQRVRKSDSNRRLIAGYEKVWNAQTHLNSGEYNQAEKAIRNGISSGLSNHTLPRLVFAKIRIQQGNPNKAEQNLKIALRGQNPSLDSYREYVNLLLNKNLVTPASQVLGKAWQELDGPVEIYPQRIQLALMRKDTSQANALLNECRVKAFQLSDECEEASELADVNQYKLP